MTHGLEQAGVIQKIPVHQIEPNPTQPRTYFSEEELDKLARSIQQEEQQEPISVIPISKRTDGICFRIHNGERRWRAHLRAGLTHIFGYVRTDLRDGSDLDFKALVINSLREYHTPMDISNALTKARANGKSAKELSDALGKSNCWIYDHLSLQNLVPELQELLHPSIPKKNRLRFQVAKVLARLPREKQMSSYEKIIKFKNPRQQQVHARHIADTTPGVQSGRGRKRKPSDYVDQFFGVIDRLDAEVFALQNIPLNIFEPLVKNRSAHEINTMLKRVDECIQHLNTMSDEIRKHTKS